MITLNLIGMGSGSPQHLTLEGIAALKAADLILLPDKGDEKAELLAVRETLCAEVLDASPKMAHFKVPQRADDPSYLQAVHHWHDAIAAHWQAQINEHLPTGGQVALLIWGDPSLYDSSLRIAERLPGLGMPVTIRVVPGITSVQALTAAHGIALNSLAGSVLFTTARQLRQQGWPEGQERIVVMPDAGGAFAVLEGAHYDIWWGAYVGMPQQVLIKGRLDQVAADIIQRRANLRAQHGWIMDVYLLARRAQDL
jgi:precorrin-6A synthase